MSTPPQGTPGNPETREETIERIAEEDLAVRATTTRRDPSTRRRLGPRMAVAACVGILTGAVVFLLAWMASGNFPLSLALGGVVLLVSAAVTPIFVAEGDDEQVDVGKDRESHARRSG